MPRIPPTVALELFSGAQVARLATVSADGAPHLVPVTFAVVGETIVFAVDDKPKSTDRLRRLDNIAERPRVAFLVDHYEQDWQRLWWIRADAVAAEIDGADRDAALDALAAKYSAYMDRRPAGPVVAARVVRWTGWRAVDDPPAPDPDAKDWTWTIESACLDCGFDPLGVDPGGIAGVLAGLGDRWQSVLGGANVKVRPAPAIWSPLEYGCHVRDVYRLFTERARSMLDHDEPHFANWDQDATALESRYWEADPVLVADQIGTAATEAAQVFGSVRPDQWDRRGFRSNGSEFTVRTLGTYFLHDVVHHLWDVGPPATGTAGSTIG